ncbi:MAG: glycoside hydrolase family 2 protein, partial [Thermoanaerobaculia bacterium]
MCRRRLVRALVLAVLALPATAAAERVASRSLTDAAALPRVRFTINESWRFAPGAHEGAESPAFDDGGWARVSLPHTWNREDAFDETPGYRRGIGWYRRELTVDPALRGRRIFLRFEGANQVADVWVNGRPAGSHAGGYTAFVFDVTELVTWDAPNLIAVRVDNSHDPDIPPLNADFTFYGGIYRDVWLIATDPVHVTLTDHASSGVYLQTPEVSRERATVRAFGTVRNDSGAEVAMRVVNRVLDHDGREVAAGRSELRAPAAGEARFDMILPAVTAPRLWSPDAPNLYRVRTEVFRDETLVDVVENPLGFRWFRADPERGFFLNGAPLKLAGTNRHQDRAGYGNALADDLHRRDVEIVEENGFNFLRLAHYPQDPAVLEAADRLGLVVWEEIPIVNLVSMTDAFAANAERMLVEMIRQHYNHPSIVFWGYMNEVMLTKPDPIPEGYYEHLLELTERLEARVHAEDPGRLTVMALSRDEVPPKDHGLGAVTDVLGFNLYFGWYYEELEALGRFLDAFHAAYPSRPLIVSEYGAGSDERVHAAAPRAFDFSSEYAQIFHRESFRQIEARAWLAGSAVWNQFDFGSEFRNDTKPALNQKGLWFFDRTPKDTAFYYRASLAGDTVLHVAREWSVRAGSRPEQRLQKVWAYTNLEEVILFVNGVTTGPLPIRNRTVEADVLLSPGANEIRASGRRGEVWYTDATTIHYEERPAAGVVVAVNLGASVSYI